MPELPGLGAIQARRDAAKKMIRALNQRRDHPEKREWIMSIPARPDHDPDLVIGAALDDIPLLLAEVERLRAALATARADALEEAALETERWGWGCDNLPGRIADAIRALIDRPDQPQTED